MLVVKSHLAVLKPSIVLSITNLVRQLPLSEFECDGSGGLVARMLFESQPSGCLESFYVTLSYSICGFEGQLGLFEFPWVRCSLNGPTRSKSRFVATDIELPYCPELQSAMV